MATSPYQTEDIEPQDAPFYTYREQTRAMLRHLILEKGYQPSHPLVAAYDYHLYMTTAHAELQKVFEQMLVMTDVRALVRACFVGCDLKYQKSSQVATSLAVDFEERDSKDESGWVVVQESWGGRG